MLSIDELVGSEPTAKARSEPDAATEAQVEALYDAVKNVREGGFHLLRQVAEGLFRGGEVPDLIRDRAGGERTSVKPIRHLKTGMVLTLAALETEGIPGFSDGLELLERLVTTHWDSVLPLPDLTDPEDPHLSRFNVLSPLSVEDPAGVSAKPGAVTTSDSWRLGDRFLQVPLLRSQRHGDVSVRDCLSPWARQMKLTLPPGEDRSPEFIAEARLASTESLPRQRDALQAALRALGGIERACQAMPATVGRPRPGFVTRLLRAALAVVEETVTSGLGAAAAVSAQPDARGMPATAAGLVANRADAVRKLAEVAEYFRRTEPSSPIPHFIDRLKRLAGMGFLDILKELELGEKAVPEFQKLTGIRDGPNKEGESKP